MLIVSAFQPQRGWSEAIVADRLELSTGDFVSRDVLLDSPDLREVQALEVLDDRSVVLAGIGSNGLKVGDQQLRAASGGGPVLMHLSPEGEPLWGTLFCYSGSYGYNGDAALSASNGVLRALVTPDTELEVGAPLPTQSGPLLLGFELHAAPPVAGEGGAPTH